MQSPGEPRPRARFLLTLALLWLAGTGLRLTILAVPPVIPLIHDGLKLNATQVGILTGLPSMLFAFAAVPGALLIARLGTRTALVVGLAITALGGALRGAIPDVAWLYAMTVAMGAGVAIMQVTMPPAVRAWFPQRIGFATAVYTNGLLDRRNNSRRADAAAGAAVRRRELAMGLRVLERAGRDHRRAGADAGAGDEQWRRVRHQPPLVAGLEQSLDLAARHHAGHDQRDLFLQQRLPARLSAQQRSGRMDQRARSPR